MGKQIVLYTCGMSFMFRSVLGEYGLERLYMHSVILFENFQYTHVRLIFMFAKVNLHIQAAVQETTIYGRVWNYKYIGYCIVVFRFTCISPELAVYQLMIMCIIFHFEMTIAF
ncbi:hypothetical protein ACJX0J_030885, partial [Zea mays]